MSVHAWSTMCFYDSVINENENRKKEEINKNTMDKRGSKKQKKKEERE